MNDAPNELLINGRTYRYHGVADLTARLPLTVAILAENLLRHQADPDQLAALTNWSPEAVEDQEIEFSPARVIMQDFTGVPCVVDLATIREAVATLGGDPALVNPQVSTQLVIDHSVIADEFGSPSALARNTDLEFQRNEERYRFLKWGQQAFGNFQVVPPGAGIVHQVNVEHLARVVMVADDLLYPDSCVGTDSHTTMVNGLGVLGWGVGGIEAEAAMLGQPISLTRPVVVGVELVGALRPGVTATDLVLLIAERLRRHGVVGKFVEFFGEALADLSVETRTTIANMSPEYGSTACLFPIDAATLDYLKLTGRDAEQVALVEAYAKAQGLWADPTRAVAYSENLRLDLADVRPSVAGPARPQDRIDLEAVPARFQAAISQRGAPSEPVDGLAPGALAIAAITSCTNTSNPSVMVAAGLLARKAVVAGLSVKPWVKTTLSPGSQVVTDYLAQAGLTPYLEQLGFYVVGYGCVTCIGNAGPVTAQIKQAVDQGLVVSAVLSGNRNFEGRISPEVRLNYLASPPLVVAYALAGTIDIDLTSQPLGHNAAGEAVYLKDLWPTDQEIAETVASCLEPAMFAARYDAVFAGSPRWASLAAETAGQYQWPDSTYIRRAPYFDDLAAQPSPIEAVANGRILALLGDSVTTDHISPAGSIKTDSPAGRYLSAQGVAPADFNSYGSRRGNHEVMKRGTFANIRLRNRLAPGLEGGYTVDFTKPDHPVVSIFEAAQSYAGAGVPLIIVAGKEYGSGSSRDWAAKGTALLGVRAVIAESYERIHRSNLVGMGVVPLQFLPGQSAASWGLTGQELISIDLSVCDADPLPRLVTVLVGARPEQAILRIDTATEARYVRHGGVLPYQARVLAGLA